LLGLGLGGDLPAQNELPGDSPDVAVLRAARDTLLRAADFAGARDPAERIVAALEQSPEGPLPADLLNLARIQAEFMEFDAAETNFLRGLELLELVDGEFSTSLIAPYQALGRVYINSRRFPEAIIALEQAQHISQRNAGLFNIEQSEIIDDMTMAQLGLGNTIEARSLQLQRLDNAIRRFGENDPQLIPFYGHLGDYYDQSRLRTSAREQYAKALALQETEYGTEDVRLLPILRKLVQIDLLLGRGGDAKARLARTLELNPDADATEHTASLAILGDAAIVEGDPAAAADYYARAYTAAGGDGTSAEDLFAEPEPIDFIPPLSAVDRGARSRPYAWGSIILAFDVSADGRAAAVRTVEANPPELMDAAYNRRIRETHFRPKLLGGRPVATSNVRLTNYFRVYVRGSDEDESEDEEPVESPQEGVDD
jgi:tetratricopeptide (TPR) repeat protein